MFWFNVPFYWPQFLNNTRPPLSPIHLNCYIEKEINRNHFAKYFRHLNELRLFTIKQQWKPILRNHPFERGQIQCWACHKVSGTTFKTVPCHWTVKSNRHALQTNNITMGVYALVNWAVSFLIKEILNQLFISRAVLENSSTPNQAFLLLCSWCPRLGTPTLATLAVSLTTCSNINKTHNGCNFQRQQLPLLPVRSLAI